MRRKIALFLVLLLSSLSTIFIAGVILGCEFRYDPDLFGMHEALTSRHLSNESLSISRAFEILHSLGVRKLRESIWRWYMRNSTSIESEKRCAVQQLVGNANLFGIEIMGYVQDFPSWMTGIEKDQQIVPHRNVTEGSEYRRFLELYEESWETLAREFREIKVWEIGNEYNLRKFLHPPEYNKTDSRTWFPYQERVDIVTDLLYYGSRGVHSDSGNPDATTVMCGLGPAANGIRDIENFLDSIYENIESGRWPSTNSDDFFQVACWHPYTSNEKPNKENWVDPNKAVYEVMKNHGDGDKRVVFSEMGFSDQCTGLSREQVAEYLLESFRLAKDNFPWLDTIYWFRLTDRDPEYANLDCSEYGYGIVETPRENWLWKPAAYAYKSLTQPESTDLGGELLTIVVTVRDADGHPIEGAHVSVSGPNSSSAYTNFTGQASFSNLTPGNYTITVSKNGYRTSTLYESINVDTEVTITIFPKPPNYTLYIISGIIGAIIAAGIVTAYFVRKK